MWYKVVLSLFLLLNMSGASVWAEVPAPTKKVVAHSEEANVTLLADERAGYYEHFSMKYGGEWEKTFPYWRNVISPVYRPRILYDDVNQDGKEELIIVLIRDHGTGLLDSEVHVFHKSKTKIVSESGECYRDLYHEILVDNPMAVVLKNTKRTLTRNQAILTIGDQQTVVDIREWKVRPEDLSEGIILGSIIQYDVRHHELRAKVSAQISPALFIGNVVISYQYQDGMYQAKKVEFSRGEE